MPIAYIILKLFFYQRRFQAEAIVLVYQYPQKLGDVEKNKI